jgi:hypothetical protein
VGEIVELDSAAWLHVILSSAISWLRYGGHRVVRDRVAGTGHEETTE